MRDSKVEVPQANATAEQISQMATALQQFQAALESLKALGLVGVDMSVPTVTATATTSVKTPEQTAAERAAWNAMTFSERMRHARDAKKAANGGVLPRKEKGKKAKPVVERPKAPDTVKEFLKWFITTEEANLYAVKCGQWDCKPGFEEGGVKTAHMLLFHSTVGEQYSKRNVAGNVVCIRPLGSKNVLFNASTLTYGRSRRDQKEPQRLAEEMGAIPVPFEVIKAKGAGGAGLDLSSLEIIARDATERLLIPPLEGHGYHGTFNLSERHFAGACVIKVENNYFLFDCDREELNHYGFNPFFAKLPGPANNVEDAYEALKPQAVKDAYGSGKAVLRQGEFFFVEVPNEDVEELMLGDKMSSRPMSFEYNKIRRKLLALGISQYEGKQREIAAHVEHYLEYVKKSRDGKIWTANGTATAIEAAALLEPMITALKQPTMINDGMPRRHKFDGSSGFPQLDRTIKAAAHPSYMAEELGYALTDGKGDAWRWGSESGLFGHWNIKLDAALGVVDDKGNSRGRHSCTAVYQRTPTEVYALGCVSHGGRQHVPKWLDGWYRVYANSAVSNWTVSGSVD